MRLKTLLGSSREVVQGCGVSFANCLYLVPLIISQNFCATHATVNQIWPEWIVRSKENTNYLIGPVFQKFHLVFWSKKTILAFCIYKS